MYPLSSVSLSTKATELWQALPDYQKQWPVLSWSQYNNFNTCGFQWYMGYKLGFATEKGRPLELGSMVHKGLQHLYTAVMNGVSPREWFETMFQGTVERWLTEDEKSIQYVADATWLLDRYSTVCEAKDLGHTVYAVEYHFLIPVTTRKGRPFLLQGYIDLITIDSNGRFWAWDHKTGQKAWTPAEVLFDPQLPLYLVCLRELGLVIDGQVTNWINSYPYKKRDEVTNDKLFKRDPLLRGTAQLVEIARTILTRADDWLDALEGSEVPLRNMRRDCRFCSFQDPCQVAMGGTPVEEALSMTHKRKSEHKHQAEELGITLEMP